MKFTLFSGSAFYPCGGWEDFKGQFDTIEAAKLWLQKESPDATFKWAHIVHDDKIILWASSSDNDCPVYGEYGFWQWRDIE